MGAVSLNLGQCLFEEILRVEILLIVMELKGGLGDTQMPRILGSRQRKLRPLIIDFLIHIGVANILHNF